MTISSETFRWSYTSTGGTTYPYTNKILSEDDLVVYVDSVLKTKGTDYTVSGVGTAAGGNVVFLAAVAAGSVVLIAKDGVEFTQEHDYTENDAFPAASHEDALDKQTNLAQKIWDYVRRSVKVAITSTLTDLEFPTPEAGKVLAWNGTATAIENVTLSGVGGISDTAYNSSTWDGITEIAPSKNAVRDKIEAIVPLFPSALGAANLKQFMNAAGTAPEWANGFKIGTLTRDADAASGDVAYTGVGFKPSAIIFLANWGSAAVNAGSIGYDNATNHYSYYNNGLNSANTWVQSAAYSIWIATASSKYQVALVKTFDADGFTLTWTEGVGTAGTLTVQYLALR